MTHRMPATSGNGSRVGTPIRFAERLTTVETLAAGVAHEINNPLAYLKSNVEYALSEIGTLLEEVSDAEASCRLAELENVLRDAAQGACRIRDVVAELLAFSRHSSHAGPSRGVDLHRVLDAVIRLATHPLDGPIRLEKHYGRVPCVAGQAFGLALAFTNVVHNAVQSLPRGRAERRSVTVSTWTDDVTGRAIVEIRDAGVGMDEDVLRRAFEPYFTTRPVGQGAGLGLPVARGIVRAVGGEIEIESKRFLGTRVQVSLPACAPRTIEGREA